jgi:hypothetical protein
MDFTLPKKVFTIYDFFEKTKNPKWNDNPFKQFIPNLKDKFNNMNIMVATNISNLNFYIVDFDINKNITPSYIIKYFKDISLRNLFSDASLNYKLLQYTNTEKTKWIEQETYKDVVNMFNCMHTNFELISYTDNKPNSDMSTSKIYVAYKVLSAADKYVFRLEIVLNHMDMDQEIDLLVYINMVTNILNSIHKKFKI